MENSSVARVQNFRNLTKEKQIEEIQNLVLEEEEEIKEVEKEL